ncbi:MAG: hypothetical protein WCG75_09595 [Armatimonadota bacterium]
MSPDLTAEFAHLDSRLDRFVERVGAYSPEVQAAPFGKSYSPLKAVEHMYLVDKGYVGFVAKFNKGKFAGKEGKPNFFYRFVLKSMTKPSNQAAPTIKKFSPESAMSLEESTRNWKEERAKFVQYLSGFGDSEVAMKHPFFGLLSPRDIFILLEKHQDYHDVRLPN